MTHGNSRAGGKQPSPELIFETLNAYQRTAALKGALEFDLFTLIGEGTNTAEALARRCAAAERGMRILCDYLVIHGFLTKEENRYGLTPDSTMFLDRRSPAYIGTVAQFLTSPTMMESYRDMAAVVRKGGAVFSEHGTLAPDDPIWIEFARSMAPMMAMPAELIAQLLDAVSKPKWKVLDIAAGHGLFGIALAKHNPNAEIAAVDWPGVLEVARENAQKAGIANRHRAIPGSAFDVNFGTDYDLVLLTNFLHHFDPPTVETLLRKVHAALAPDGRAVTLEFVPNEDRVSPPIAAAFSMIMLGTTPSGDAYTFPEYQRMFLNAGFRSSELHPLPPTFQQVILSHK
jgi:2-polyprenyl-3-methyl-5-hydroxy-6-metoxy-1,4-benzoquinol methylase